MTDIPENALRARQMYQDGEPIRAIKAETGFSDWTLYHWIEGGPKEKGQCVLPPLVKRQAITRRRFLKEDRAALVTRMMRAAERQVYEIETRLAGSQQQPGDRERDARTLAVLAKTVQSLAALDVNQESKAGRRKKQIVDDDDEDLIPTDIDALRRELSQRMEAMAAGDQAGISDTADE